MPKPHDSLFKRTFTNVKYATVELRALLPPALLAKLELETLRVCPGSFIDRALWQQHSDLLYSVRFVGRRAYVYVLMEHQSEPDPLMVLRLLIYLVRIWQEHLRRAKQQGDSALPLPVIIPLVIHHGPQGWTAARHFHELFDSELLQLEGVAELLPSFSFLLDDLGTQSDAALQARARRRAELLAPLVLWVLRDGRNRERLLRSLLEWAPLMRAAWHSPEGVEELGTLWKYISVVTPDLSEHDLSQALSATFPPSDGFNMATLAEQWLQRGIEKGVEQGIEQGIEKGRRQTLARQLELKFGSVPGWVAGRVERASSEELARWTERVLTANSLAAVFE